MQSKRMQNLRFVICMNPEGEGYASRLEANPSLLSETTILWFDGGSTEDQRTLAEAILEEVFSGGEGRGIAGRKSQIPLDLDASQLVQWLQAAHSIALRRRLAAPHHFAALVRQCLAIWRLKRSEMGIQIDFLQVRCASLKDPQRATLMWHYMLC
jgi:hypothetical protein